MSTRLLKVACACVFVLTAPTTTAELVDNGGGLIYDTVLDITWAQPDDALRDGGEATLWATELNLGGVGGWGLAGVDPEPNLLESAVDCATATELECRENNQLGYMFYYNLGGAAGQPILDSGDPDLALFPTLQSIDYWADAYWKTGNKWYFSFTDGSQGYAYTLGTPRYAWAVHGGNVKPMPLVGVDIRPGSKRNVINPREKGGIWVAIFSDTDSASPFDPSSQVDIPTVEFGPDGARAVRHKVKDINKDGLGDLLLRFMIPDTGIACGDTEAALTGETFEGQSFTGTDTIKTVGCKQPKLIHDPATGYVTSILGLNVDGTLYNVTFHLGVPYTELFGSLYDDPDPVPDQPQAAAEAIATALGSSEQTNALGDSFHIPVQTDFGPGETDFYTVSDLYNQLDVDVIGNVTFSVGHTGGADWVWYPAEPLVTLEMASHGDKHHNKRHRKACHDHKGKDGDTKKHKEHRNIKKNIRK